MAKDSRINNLLLSAAAILIVIFSWHIIASSGYVKSIFLPSPRATLTALADMLYSGRFVSALTISFLRIATATILAVIAGAVIGILMGMSKKADSLLSPITQPLRYLPMTALIPLLILWFGIGETMKIMFLFIGIIFYFIPLVSNAIKTVSKEYIDVAKSFGAKTRDIIRHVYVPHAMPQIFDGLIVINGIGCTYVILAELINAQDGLGYLINIAGRLQRTNEVFAGLILIAVVAIASDRILHYIKKKYFFW